MFFLFGLNVLYLSLVYHFDFVSLVFLWLFMMPYLISSIRDMANFVFKKRSWVPRGGGYIYNF